MAECVFGNRLSDTAWIRWRERVRGALWIFTCLLLPRTLPVLRREILAQEWVSRPVFSLRACVSVCALCIGVCVRMCACMKRVYLHARTLHVCPVWLVGMSLPPCVDLESLPIQRWTSAIGAYWRVIVSRTISCCLCRHARPRAFPRRDELSAWRGILGRRRAGCAYLR